jgi:hypothetical protein
MASRNKALTQEVPNYKSYFNLKVFLCLYKSITLLSTLVFDSSLYISWRCCVNEFCLMFQMECWWDGGGRIFQFFKQKKSVIRHKMIADLHLLLLLPLIISLLFMMTAANTTTTPTSTQLLPPTQQEEAAFWGNYSEPFKHISINKSRSKCFMLITSHSTCVLLSIYFHFILSLQLNSQFLFHSNFWPFNYYSFHVLPHTHFITFSK